METFCETESTDTLASVAYDVSVALLRMLELLRRASAVLMALLAATMICVPKVLVLEVVAC